MRAMRLLSVAFIGATWIAVASAGAHAAPLFLPLGTPWGPYGSFFGSLSADGSTVAGAEGEWIWRWRSDTGWQQLLRSFYSTNVQGVSRNGGVVVGTFDVSGSLNSPNFDPSDLLDTRAFRYVAGGEPPAAAPPCASGSFESSSYGVSASGAIEARTLACFTSGGTVLRAMRFEGGVGWQSLGTLPGTTASQALGVSGDGSAIVGWSSGGSGAIGFRWTASGGLQQLPSLAISLGAPESLRISFDGTVVAGSGISANGKEAFVWSQASGTTFLGDLPGGAFESHVSRVSSDGSTVTGWSQTAAGPEAFVWTAAGGMVALGELPGGDFGSFPETISADGSQIFGRSYTPDPGLSEAFVWDAAHGMRRLQDALEQDYGLDLTGWVLRNVEGISDDGKTLFGYGTDPGGFDYVPWIVVIPEPGPGALLALGVAALAAGGRRRALRGG